jgi:hypothetical protein
MIPEDGNYYPWQVELWAWAKERELKSGVSMETADPKAPLPKLSDVLKCLDSACAQPEIWDRYNNLQAFTQEDSFELGGFVSSYVSWYLGKNSMRRFNPYAFGSTHRLMWRLAEGAFKREDVSAIKDELGPWFWVDDLPQYPSRRGINQ